jgi:hypothetical protein
MKIPFPYKIAAEFYLFYPPSKLTIIHILITLTSIFNSFTIFYIIKNNSNNFLLVITVVVVFIFSLIVQYYACCRMFSFLLKASDIGWLDRPDKELMRKQIELNSCRKS